MLLVADALLLPLAVWASFWLRLEQPFSDAWLQSGPWMVTALWMLGLPLFVLSGQYKGLTRYVGSRSLYQLGLRMAVLTMVILATGELLKLPMPPRSCWLLFWVISTTVLGALRFSLRDLFFKFSRFQGSASQQRVVIYGAGAAGIQLASSLRHSGIHRLLAFVDVTLMLCSTKCLLMPSISSRTSVGVFFVLESLPADSPVTSLIPIGGTYKAVPDSAFSDGTGLGYLPGWLIRAEWARYFPFLKPRCRFCTSESVLR